MIFNIASVDKITDGDTVHVTVDLGFKISARVIVRLKDINCPEIATDAGRAAKSFTTAWLHTASQPLKLHCHGQDKYAGRWLGDIQQAGRSLAHELVRADYAEVVV
jgi:endonuclease YncB( thermonuclease family)